MNERIKELLNQATTDALYETKDAIDFLDNPVSKQQRELQLEKFAELIVKKCMDVAKYHTPDTEECEYTWLIHDKIKEHFGVE